MIYELYLEGQLADIRQDLGMQLSYAIDDINKYGSRETSFSKTIVLPGTANNNRLLGFVGELGSNNPIGGININSSFNPAQTTKAELRANGLLLLKGIFRLTGIVKDREMIEYEGSLFGELGGFISAIGNGKLEDLDFSEYNHVYTRDNIVGSWDSKVTKLVGGAFNQAAQLIFIFNNYDLKLKIGDTIIITGTSNNDDTYLITDYFNYNDATIIIEVNKFIQNEFGAFTIQYPSPEGLGSGYFYPLIDYGRYSAAKLNYDYRTFRPALFVKEYIDKMFLPTGYTYESNFFNTEFFKRLIIPNNAAQLQKIVSNLLDVRSPNEFSITNNSGGSLTPTIVIHDFQIENIKDNFTGDGDPDFTYTGATTDVNIKLNVKWKYNLRNISFSLRKNDNVIFEGGGRSGNPNVVLEENFSKVISLQNNDKIYFRISVLNTTVYFLNIELLIESTNPITAPVELNDNVTFSEILPKNILQKDFFSWIMKMFNLYITEDKVKEKHLIIEPYKDYYKKTKKKNVNGYFDFNVFGFDKIGVYGDDLKLKIGDIIIITNASNVINNGTYTIQDFSYNSTTLLNVISVSGTLVNDSNDNFTIEYPVSIEDWTYKVSRDKAWNIKPMGMLNGRFFEYKYKEDNDFYNEGYKKKYNLPYGSNLQDTGFQFAKDKQTTEIGFSPTPLVKYSGEDKVVSAIYKVSKGNDVDQEEQTDSNIRILMVKKITGVDAWYITDNGADLQQPPTNLGGSLTGYGYAGHFDDPTDPTVDINFGAAEEIYCQPNTYPSNNLFNTYWSGYIAEIADKDSKILTCHVYLTELDIAQLDFSKPVFIDGSLWRINKIMDFDASAGELTKVELLKVINNG